MNEDSEKQLNIRIEVIETNTYYKEFHHKCVSWFVTLMGLLIAGELAAEKAEATRLMGQVLITSGIVFSVIFIVCIGHYSKRIQRLTIFCKEDQNIPFNWHELHRKPGFSISGVGDWFFLCLILTLLALQLIIANMKFI